MVGGHIVDRQQKRRRRDDNGETAARTEVRNVSNGWVFCREGCEAIPEADAAAVQAVKSLGLDWGAVDLKVNQQRTRVGVLEVNTAPGLEGTTLEAYARGIRRLI